MNWRRWQAEQHFTASALLVVGLLPCLLVVHTWRPLAGLTLMLILSVSNVVWAWRRLRRAMAADARARRRHR
jgi:hypothetical protein